ncbi:hypothetical protein AB6A40_000536 [Gnathostoma spinigerum]|uniref:K Homology domain-containing protein n=1 Tax=Gnathostoma spinigerum TaxID=75299 RepID=A0ABD6E4D3_9BILA
MPMMAMPRSVCGAGSSQGSEEGFVSGSSADDATYVDRLAVDLGAFGISTNNPHSFPMFDMPQHRQQQQKCSSDSGVSCGDADSTLILSHDLINRMPVEGSGALSCVVQQNSEACLQMPGAWFYEVGSDETSGSPTADFSDEIGSLRAALSMNARNITESVEVPSSEHVAEIVGRQGCKIKALRAKTNTYIKTPVRGEEPIFVVTGRPEDVADAKREIECAAEHFTQIRASRRHSQGGAPAPGHITAYVRVPLRVVGLVVGPKGATIKRIQQDTHTYIITPSREREPIFEVTGLPQNVEAARREIEQHIYQRTGNMPITDPNASIGSYSYEIQGNLSTNCTNSRPPAFSYASLAQQPRRAPATESLSLGQYIPDYRQNGNEFGFTPSTVNDLVRCGIGAKPFSSVASSSPSLPNSSSSSNQLLFNPTELSPSAPVLLQQSKKDQSCGSFLTELSSTRGSSQSPNPSGLLTGSYPTWSPAYSSLTETLNNNDLFSSKPFLGSFFNMNNGCSSSFSQQASVSSNDEGIGESPSSGLGPLSSDPYHLMMSSIWSDLENSRESQGGSLDAAAIATA